VCGGGGADDDDDDDDDDNNNNNMINYGTIIFVLSEQLRGEFLFVNVLNTDFREQNNVDQYIYKRAVVSKAVTTECYGR
jgi:hypothetical protein